MQQLIILLVDKPECLLWGRFGKVSSSFNIFARSYVNYEWPRTLQFGCSGHLLQILEI